MKCTEELVKKAYKKLKCSVYFDKTQLLLRQQIVDFEDEDIDIDEKLSKLYCALMDDEKWEQQKEISKSISYKAFPKSLVDPKKKGNDEKAFPW